MCFVHDNDGEMVLASDHVVARRTHQCDECRGPIEPRSRYRRIKSLFDGSVSTLVECARCETIRNLIHEREIAEGCAWSESWAPLGGIDEYLSDRGLTFDGAALVARPSAAAPAEA